MIGFVLDPTVEWFGEPSSNFLFRPAAAGVVPESTLVGAGAGVADGAEESLGIVDAAVAVVTGFGVAAEVGVGIEVFGTADLGKEAALAPDALVVPTTGLGAGTVVDGLVPGLTAPFAVPAPAVLGLGGTFFGGKGGTTPVAQILSATLRSISTPTTLIYLNRALALGPTVLTSPLALATAAIIPITLVKLVPGGAGPGIGLPVALFTAGLAPTGGLAVAAEVATTGLLAVEAVGGTGGRTAEVVVAVVEEMTPGLTVVVLLTVVPFLTPPGAPVPVLA